MDLQLEEGGTSPVSWDVRFNNAISRYSAIKGPQAQLIPAIIRGLEEWAANLPYVSCDSQGCYEPANIWGLGAESTEIYAIVDWLILHKRHSLADSLRKKYQALCISAQSLDELYPKANAQHDATEKRLIQMCKRQATQLNSFLEGLFRVAFKVSQKNSRKHEDTPHPSSHRKRSKRTVEIEMLEKALIEHIKSARNYAKTLLDAGKEPSLLPRPTKLQLGAQTGIKPWSLSRCFNDPNAHQLRLLWDIAEDLEQILRSRK